MIDNENRRREYGKKKQQKNDVKNIYKQKKIIFFDCKLFLSVIFIFFIGI